jgi:ribosome biogenesis GTPase A
MGTIRMTVFEAYSKLWEFFKENDSFVMEEDFRKVSLVSETPTRDRAAMQSALDDWTKNDLLTRQEQTTWNKEIKDNETKTVYVLRKPLDSNDQTVTIHSNLATYMMKEINGFCELIDDKTDLCDPSDLDSKDVLNLIHILNFYKNKYREEIGADIEKDS